MPKTEFLQIRLTPEDRQRLRRVAASEFIEQSTWARRAILRALEQWEAEQRQRHLRIEPKPGEAREPRRVAEPKPKRGPKGSR
ncbi:MAG TPA: hypothetical protein VFW98_14220 [Gemmatimonadaceae bacterium]|nr:hypothetical protein [Gemmatimonadaceae bacterium]